MRISRLPKTVLVGITALLCTVAASAQQVRFFPNFSSVANLQMNGSAHQATVSATKVLRLTDGYPGVGATHPETATSWFSLPASVDPNLGRQPVSSGFTTYFKFQISTAAICCTPGDGLAFVVQNSSVTAIGTGFGGLAYAGIPNSLAIEFDTFKDGWDPNANHVAVQSCGTAPNSPVHTVGSCLVGTGISTNVPHLGVTCGTSTCANGVPHEVVIEYTPPVVVTANGTLKVWVDAPFIPGTHTPLPTAVPAINVPYNINNTYNPQGISLAGGTSAWVGFSADQPNAPQAHDIIAWEFTPHTPTEVQQVIPPGGTQADYIFGGHDTTVNYFPGFVNDPNDPFLMRVVATPIARNVFYQTRILTQAGRPFVNEQCLVYLQTGGNCIVYSITCQRQSNPNVDVTCPVSINQCTQIDQTGCITFSTSFYTADPVNVNNADYLKTDPIGSSNWVSIFQSYDPNVLDGRTTGTGKTPSDFVATFKLLTHN